MEEELTEAKNSGEAEEQPDYEKLFKEEQARRRGLQSENAKIKNELSLTKAEADKLKELTVPKLSKEDSEKLEDLKYSDPDAYYEERKKVEAKVDTTVNEYLGELKQQKEEESKKKQLDKALVTLSGKYEDFREYINESTLDTDIPPSLVKSYKEGNLSMEEYLEKAYRFAVAAKQVNNPDSTTVPDLGRAGGGVTPTKQAVDGDLNSTYSKTIF